MYYIKADKDTVYVSKIKQFVIKSESSYRAIELFIRLFVLNLSFIDKLKNRTF